MQTVQWLVTDGQSCTCNIILGQKKPTMISCSTSSY